MRTTKGHAPFEDVLRAANITLLPSRPLPISKTKPELEKKQPNALRKSRRSSDSTNTSTNVSSRNPSTDVLSTTTPAPSQTNTSKPQTQPPAVPERKKSHRRRRSVLRTSTVGSKSPMPTLDTKMVARPDNEEKGARVVTSTPASPISTFSANQGDLAFMTVTTPTSADESTDPEVKWMEDRHRSLQKIKERKNARRGLSLVDERQATLSMSMSQSRSHSHSRPPSISPPLSPSPSMSHAPSPRQARHRQRSSAGVERAGTRSRRTSSSGGPRGFTMNEHELGVQSDTGVRPRRETNKGVRSRSVSRREDDDVVLLGREARMSRISALGRDYTRQEKTSSAGVKPNVGDDFETLSDKTLVHQ